MTLSRTIITRTGDKTQHFFVGFFKPKNFSASSKHLNGLQIDNFFARISLSYKELLHGAIFNTHYLTTMNSESVISIKFSHWNEDVTLVMKC